MIFGALQFVGYPVQKMSFLNVTAYAILNGISCDKAADRWTVHTVKCVCVSRFSNIVCV